MEGDDYLIIERVRMQRYRERLKSGESAKLPRRTYELRCDVLKSRLLTNQITRDSYELQLAQLDKEFGK